MLQVTAQGSGPQRLETARRLRFDAWLLAPPIAALVLFLAGNDSIAFDPPGWLDTFIYVGYFWHYPEHLPQFAGYYKASRLPWILPGFVLHSLFSDVTASYVLHWTVLSAGGAAVYLLIRDLLRDRIVAALLGVAWVTLIPGHGVGGWNYHMHAAAAYYVAACWLAVRAARAPGSWTWSLLSGAAMAAAIHTNLLLALFLPLLALLYLTLLEPPLMRRLRETVRTAGSMATGGLGLTFLLSAINAGTGGIWLFFMPQIEYARWISEQGNNAWWFATANWLPTATWLVIPAIACVVSAAALAFVTPAQRRLATSLTAQAWLAAAFYCFYQFVKRQSVLDHDYMAFALYCHAFPALAVFFMAGRARLTDSRVRLALIAAISIMTAALLMPLPGMWNAFHGTVDAVAGGWPRVVPPFVAGTILALPIVFLPRSAAIVAFACWFALVNVWVGWSGRPYGIATPGPRRVMFELFGELDRFTTPIDPSLLGIKYWYPQEVVEGPGGTLRLDDVFVSYVSTRGGYGNLLGGTSGAPLDQLGAQDLIGFPCVGLLSSDATHESSRQQLVDRISELGASPHRVVERRFTRPGLGISLTILRLGEPSGGEAGTRASCQS